MTIGAVIIAGLIIAFVILYNGLIIARNRVKEAWSDIDVQLKRRFDLIPNLVETVKGYASHEKETLDRVISARAKAMEAQGAKAAGEADNELQTALKSIFALSEAYPQLRAVESFTKLQDELTDTEDKIQASRRFYNSNVLVYNTKIETVPSNIVASMFSFTKEEFFQIEKPEEKEPVQVKF